MEDRKQWLARHMGGLDWEVEWLDPECVKLTRTDETGRRHKKIITRMDLKPIVEMLWPA